MNTLINVKIDPKVKNKAQKVAAGLGLSLSAVVNAYLRQFIRTETLFVSSKNEEPTDFLLESIRASAEDKKKGKVYAFEDKSKALDFLDQAIARK